MKYHYKKILLCVSAIIFLSLAYTYLQLKNQKKNTGATLVLIKKNTENKKNVNTILIKKIETGANVIPSDLLKEKVNSNIENIIIECKSIYDQSIGMPAIELLTQILEHPPNDLLKCADAIKKYSPKFNLNLCLLEIKNKISNEKINIKNCQEFININSWKQYNSQNTKVKNIELLTKQELASAFHAVFLDESLKIEDRFQQATQYAIELLKRDPNDKYAINMLIRSSMVDNENGLGYIETMQWIKKGLNLDPNNEALVSHYLQRLSYTGPLGREKIRNYLKVHPTNFAAQVIVGTYDHNNTDSELISYFQKNKQLNPQFKDKYDLVISLINQKQPYFFKVVNFRLDTVPNYL